jgi:hypothetical protein
VSDIAAHIARWQGGTPPPPPTLVEPRGANPAYQVKLAETPVTLMLNDYLWSPANFAPLVSAPSAVTATTCDTPDLLKRLLTPTVKVLVEADELLSKRLQEAPQNPCLHEAAAVLLAVFQMRERAHGWSDNRPALNQMAAHLSIAKVLRNGAVPGVEGRLAELMVRALAWRHDGFPEELKGLAANAAEPERTWLRVISLYSVQDWRELATPGKASLAERLAYSFALANKTGPSRVLGFLDQHAKEHISDWPRLAFARGSSVEVCGRFGEISVPAVLSEIVEAHQLIRGQKLEVGQIAEALNEEAYASSLHVLDWPLWAGFEQRNLSKAVRDEHDCLEYTYGLHEEATAYRGRVASHFGKLRLAPFLLAHLATSPDEYQRAATSAVTLVKERPDLVSYSNWAKVESPPHHWPAPAGVPNTRPWFAPIVPHGTALDYNIRFTAGLLPPQDLVEASTHHVFHVLARRLYAQRVHGEKPPVAFLKTLYGSTVEFDRDSLVSIAASAKDTEPAELIAATRSMCDMEADDCNQIAEYLKDHGDPEGAAREYQRWFDTARNRVGVSNDIEWLVNYYFDRGEKEKALAIARDAADTYSAKGLRTLSALLEKLGRYSEAEEYLQKVNERYDNVFPLYEFFGRNKDVPSVKKSLDIVLADVFPDGHKPVRKEDIGLLPPAGAKISGLPDHGAGCGLEVGDRIVGIDGIRVNSLQQLRLQNRLSTATECTIIYWRKGTAVEASVPRLTLRAHHF